MGVEQHGSNHGVVPNANASSVSIAGGRRETTKANAEGFMSAASRREAFSERSGWAKKNPSR
jgi:hypothetical protein